MVQYQYLFLLLGGWGLVLVGVALALTVLPDRWPWMSASPLTGLLLGIPLVFWVYLPVPTLVKAGVCAGWRGSIVLGVWCSLWLLGLGGLIAFQLPSAFLIPLMAWFLLALFVAAHQWKAMEQQ